MTQPTESAVSHSDRFRVAKETDVPELYFNGFAIAISSGDANVVLERNGTPIAILNMSFTLAKTLALSLGNSVSSFEQVTGQQLLTTHDVDRLFNEASDKESRDVQDVS